MNARSNTGRNGLWVVLFCLLSLVASAQEAGHSIGTASVDNNGSAHYSMPIIVSPGTNGMQPNIAITYSHNGGNGLLGEGFALQGFSMITRVPATLAEDGFYDPVDFDINDRYALDGERLYVVSGTHGADGSRYRTEHESFSRITAHGSVGGEPQYFVVETNDGLIMEFGKSANSGVEAAGKPDILSWRISKMEDRHGNYMTFHYVENTGNTESYPEHIEYTGNGFNNQVPYASVSFVYESRNDAPARYVYGSLQRNSKRLKSITCQYGNEVYRSYTLNYEESAGARLSLLNRIEECGSDGGCYDAVTFDWSEAQSAPSFGPLETWTSAFAESAGPAWVLSEHPREVADVNGDGKADIVGFGEDGTYLSLSKGDHFEVPAKVLSTYGDDAAAGSWFELPRMLADVNGDGRADIVALKEGNVHVAVSTGTGFKADSIWLSNLNYTQTAGKLKGALADVDGNGSADLLIVRDDGVYVATSKGKGFASPSLWVYNECCPGTTTSAIYFADADGDGLCDAIQACEGQVRVAVSLSYTFSSWQDWLELPARIDQDWSTYSLGFQDMNDDAKADLVRWQENGIHVSLAGDDQYTNPERWLPNFGSQQEWNQYPKCFEDINADQLTDLIVFMEDSVFVGIGTGSKFRKERPFIANFGYNEASLESTRPPLLADADGDGRADIYNFGDHGVEVAKSTGIAFEQPNVWVSGFSANPEWSAEKHPRDLLDIDADGLPDIIAFGDDGIKIAINNGSGFDRPYLDLPFFGYSDAAGAWRSDKHLRTFGDINGDGYPDLLGSDDDRTYIAFGNGTGFDARQVAFEGYGASAAAGGWKTDVHFRYLADVTGDGRDDFVAFGGQGVWVGVSNGTTIATPTQWTTSHSAGHIHRPKYIVDINGDGYSDVFDFNSSRIYYSLSDGEGFGPVQTWNGDARFTEAGNWYTGYYLRQPVDLNGDGNIDVLGVTSAVFASINTGTAGVTSTTWLGSGFPNVKDLNRNPHFVVDVNGDGFPDIVDMYDAGTYVTLNTGSSFIARVKVTDNMGNDGEGPDYGSWDQLRHSRQLADVNGDGLPDLVGIGRRGVEVSLNQLHNPWVVTRVNNAGFITEYEYGQLTSDALYTKGTAASFPDNTVQVPITVVQELRASNGIGGMNHHRYTYSNAVFNRQGRGFKGFGGSTHTQVESGIRTESSFSHETRFAQTPLLRRRQFLTSNNRLISHEQYELQSFDVESNITFSFASKITRQTYDPTGNALSSEIEQYEYDTWGNITYFKRIDGGVSSTIVYSEYHNNGNGLEWVIGRKTKERKEYYQPGSPSEYIEIAYQYSNDWNKLIREVREPNRAEYKLTKNYSHDAFGNLKQQEIIGNRGTGTETRSTHSTYDPLGRFIITATNEMGHSSTYGFDPLSGNVLSYTGPNGLSTTTHYDGFGRPVLQIAPDGVETRYRYEPVRSGNNSYRVIVQAEGRPEYQTWYDYKDRIVCKAWTGFGGNMVYEKVQFNTEGQLDRVSEPHYSGENIRWTRYDYDPIGRVIRESAADNSSQQITYQGLVKTTLNQLGQALTEEYNKRGQLLSKTDHLNNTTSFAYDAMGRLITVTDVAGNQLQTTYDPLGRKLSVADPDLGLTQYTYNAFGEMISAINARGKETLYDYDKLGRLTARQIEEGTVLFEYDNAPHGIGKLSKEITDYNGFEKHYSYDDWGRLSETTHVDPDGTQHRMQHRYNSLGQETELIYPGGFRVLNRFDEWGYLTEVLKEEDLSLYWQAGSYNAQGQATNYRYGNGLETQNTYDPYRGWLSNTYTAGLQNLSFVYDPLGNLMERSDDRQGLRETFEYDGLNRLIESKVRNENSVMLTYDALGNITYKSDVGCYEYVGARPHAVRTIKDANGQISREYLYDAAGNMIRNHDISMGYTSFNKVRSLSRAADAMYFNYGAANELLFQRIEQNGSQVSSKRFIDRIYELEQFSDGTQKATHYILANGVAVATHETSSSTVPKTRYLHRDHLGSLSAITDGKGNFVERVSFDPWGQRRDASTWAAAASVSSSMDRGFTGHEHLAPFHLIHMGGRVYDPIIGRFSSPDPFVQQAEGQNLNRYSYVLNNPLSFTDPSGFFFKKLFKSIGRFVKKVVKAVVNVVKSIVKNPLKTVAVAAAVYFGGAAILGGLKGIGLGGTFFTSTTMTAAYGGFTGGVASGLINGQSLGEAVQIGLSGAFVAGLTAGAVSLTQGFMPSWSQSVQVDKPFGHDALRRIKSQIYHMTFKSSIKGVAQKLTGGKFEDGFYSSFASDLIKWGRNAYVEWQLMKSPMWTGQGLKDGEKPYSTGERQSVYNNMMATLRPSQGPAVPKPEGTTIEQFAVYGQVANVGEPNSDHWLTGESGFFLNAVSKIPGFNSMSVHHDAFATAVWDDNQLILSNIISKTTIPPYIVLEYAALKNDMGQ